MIDWNRFRRGYPWKCLAEVHGNRTHTCAWYQRVCGRSVKGLWKKGFILKKEYYGPGCKIKWSKDYWVCPMCGKFGIVYGRIKTDLLPDHVNQGQSGSSNLPSRTITYWNYYPVFRGGAKVALFQIYYPVEHSVRDAGVAGSNLVFPTNKIKHLAAI